MKNLCCWYITIGYTPTEEKTIKRRMKTMEKKAVTIFTAKVARMLLKDGYTIVDIKPDKTDEDGKRSVFVFKNENNIIEKIKEYKENKEK